MDMVLFQSPSLIIDGFLQTIRIQKTVGRIAVYTQKSFLSALSDVKGILRPIFGVDINVHSDKE